MSVEESTAQAGRPVLPPWPAESPAHGAVVLREFSDDDLYMVLNLARDRYACLMSTLTIAADRPTALQWITQQKRRYLMGMGYSVAIADAASGKAVGQIGLWTGTIKERRVTCGYSVAPVHRGKGYAADALAAITEFAWTVPGIDRVELYIEPTNEASWRTGEKVGYTRDALVPEHSFIDGIAKDMYRYVVDRPA